MVIFFCTTRLQVHFVITEYQSLIDFYVSHTDSNDYHPFIPIYISSILIVPFMLQTIDDDVALEYDDRIVLTYVPENLNFLEGIEEAGEYIRITTLVIIEDNDSRFLKFVLKLNVLDLATDVNINFEETGYSVGEGGALMSTISVYFTRTQSPFTLALRSLSIDKAETIFNLTNFIDSSMITELYRAIPGNCYRYLLASLAIYINFFDV